LYSGLWAFDGWDQANYVGGEIHEPEKNIPRAIHSSMALVTVRHFMSAICCSAHIRLQLLFLCANVSYFVVLDKVPKIRLFINIFTFHLGHRRFK
jgi:amino acid transporter